MSEISDCGGDAAAYVLAALEPSEADQFRRHLESCVVCSDEVAAFQQVVGALPVAAPQQPIPRGLRRRIMREVRAEPALDTPPRRRRQRRQLIAALLPPRPALAGGLLATAALMIVGGLQLGSGSPSGVRVISASVTGLPGSAQLRVTGGRAELIVSHFPPPPGGRIYEVWIKRGGQPPAPTHALFSVTAAGSADVGVPGDLRGVSAIMVTQEPAGGSLVPTRAPVIRARLS